jgi:hypothetical protein
LDDRKRFWTYADAESIGGVVQAVTREYNAVTIQHEAIPEYDMPAMVMEFTVDDASQLQGLAAGDIATFELRSGLDISTNIRGRGQLSFLRCSKTQPGGLAASMLISLRFGFWPRA